MWISDCDSILVRKSWGPTGELNNSKEANQANVTDSFEQPEIMRTRLVSGVGSGEGGGG